MNAIWIPTLIVAAPRERLPICNKSAFQRNALVVLQGMNKIMTVVFLLAALIGGGFTALAVGPKVATPANSDKIYAEGLQLFGDLGNDGALKRGFKLFQQ